MCVFKTSDLAMDSPKGFHLVWPILMLLLAVPFRSPELKGQFELSDDPVFSSKQQAASRNLSVRDGLGSCRPMRHGFKRLELVDGRTAINKPYSFAAHRPFWLRSSAVSIHDTKNLFSIVAIVFVSILMGFILISLFQR